MEPTSKEDSAGAASRFFKAMFLASGTYALTCIPAVFIFEHFRWYEGTLHFTSFWACILAVVGAAGYFVTTPPGEPGGDEKTLGFSTRNLAVVTLLLAGSFILFAAFVVARISSMRSVEDVGSL